MNQRRVVVTGTGLITALGDSRQTVHEALCRGRHGLKRAELFDDAMLEAPLVGEITRFEPSKYLGERNFRPLDRTSQLLVCAAKLTLDDSGWTAAAIANFDVGLAVGTTFCSLRTISSFDRRALEEGPSLASPLDFANTVINAAAGQTGIWHNLRGVNSTISTGITSALEAIDYASGLIRQGRERAILAGGVEELCVESLLAFQRAGLLSRWEPEMRIPTLFGAGCNAIALAEGAALLMLEDYEFALNRGATILAEILGSGSSFDCSFELGATDTFTERRSLCLAESIATSLEQSQLNRRDVQAISVSANGLRACDNSERRGLAHAFSDCLEFIPLTGIKPLIGECLGASAAVQTIEAIAALNDGRLPNTLDCSGINRSTNNQPQHIDLQHDACRRSPVTECREAHPKNCLVTSVGLDGHCSALMLGGPNKSLREDQTSPNVTAQTSPNGDDPARVPTG